ncbi:hypothetical protein [Aliifodinibius sp. S!AR15-10]|uniref:hypothetical protein n=1 Tax=Aliifodinibius sp. S!AR15-10 TaxID=2950437 RepID=UPI0028705087|nr:hypothetical protein [Aliifodinibius sp. S!AR15-10]
MVPYALRWDLLGRSAFSITYGATETRSVRGASAAELTEASNWWKSPRATRNADKCRSATGFWQLEG